jgi:hypothetical protein
MTHTPRREALRAVGAQPQHPLWATPVPPGHARDLPVVLLARVVTGL